MIIDIRNAPKDFDEYTYTILLDGEDVSFICVYADDEKKFVEIIGTNGGQNWCDKHWQYQMNLEPTSLFTAKVWGNVSILKKPKCLQH